MTGDSAIGLFLIVTGLVALVPVAWQRRVGRLQPREALGFAAVSAGLLTTGVGLALFSGVAQVVLSAAGIVVMATALLQQRRQQT